MMILVKVLLPLNNKSFNKGLALASCFLALSIINDTPKLYLTDTENTKIIEVVQQITKKYEDANFKVYLAGSALFSGLAPVITANKNDGII
jgi:hypothetical protein